MKRSLTKINQKKKSLMEKLKFMFTDRMHICSKPTHLPQAR